MTSHQRKFVLSIIACLIVSLALIVLLPRQEYFYIAPLLLFLFGLILSVYRYNTAHRHHQAPEIPDLNEAGIMHPPWIKFPNIPKGSIGWRMGAGEAYLIKFEDWYLAQPRAIQTQMMQEMKEPLRWKGFYKRLQKR